MGGIADKVAIVGMGCTKFGERWGEGPEDLLVEAAQEAFEDAGVEAKDIDAAWFGPQVRLHPDHARGELLRHGNGRLPKRLLRGRRGRL